MDAFFRSARRQWLGIVDSKSHLQGYMPYQYVLDSRNYLQVLITIISI